MRVEEAAEAISLGVISVDEAIAGLFGMNPELEEGLSDMLKRAKTAAKKVALPVALAASTGLGGYGAGHVAGHKHERPVAYQQGLKRAFGGAKASGAGGVLKFRGRSQEDIERVRSQEWQRGFLKSRGVRVPD